MFVKRGLYFDADSGGAEGGDTSTDEGKDAGNLIPPQETEPKTDPVKEPKDKEIKLTSAQLKERLDRAEASAKAKFLKDFGYDDPAKLKEFLDAGKAALEAQKTESERQQEALQLAQEKAEKLEAEITKAEERAQAAFLQAEALALMAGKFANPRVAIKLLDMTNVKIESGNVSGLDEAVERLAQEEPWTLAKPELKTPSKFTSNPQGKPDPTKESDAEKAKRYFGSVGGGDFFKGSGVRTNND